MELWARTTASSTTLPLGNMLEQNAVLREMFELLQDYAPTWYTEDLHNRAAAALGELHPAI